MSAVINARIPPRVEQELADYCAKRGITRSPYSLAVDLIPPRGVKELQSGKVRELARKAFRGSRTR